MALAFLFLQYDNKKRFIKLWARNKTEIQKINIDVEVEVSGWLCPNQDPEAVFLDFEYYQN